jgi:YD repeat-containing protein
MQIRQFIAVSITAALMSGSAIAQSQQTDPVIDGIVSSLAAEGYAKIEVRRTLMGRYKVEARNQFRETERLYDGDGNLLEEQTDGEGEAVERRYDASGNLVSEDIQSDDESDDDGEDDDDHGSDDDHGGDGSSDDDHGDDHDSDGGGDDGHD